MTLCGISCSPCSKDIIDYSEIKNNNSVSTTGTVITNQPYSNKQNKTIFESIGNCYGFKNPSNFCFLNSVLQVVRGCVDFTKEFMELEMEDNQKISKSFQNLLKSFKENRNKINVYVEEMQRYFEASNLNGDDVHIVYLNFLSAIHKELKTTNSTTDTSNLTYYEKQKLKNDSIIFKYFYGAMQYKTNCKTCGIEIYSTNQLIKSFPLSVPKSDEKIKLKDCIKTELSPTSLKMEDQPNCDCKMNNQPEIEFINRFTSAPQYLFIYLNRGSYYSNVSKNETYITYEGPLNISLADDKLVKYQLISVIDHTGSSDGGHYYCKCNYETDQWWLLNDTQVENIDASEPVTNFSNTFIFKKD